jgi:S-adenosylmethionine decarboxylase
MAYTPNTDIGIHQEHFVSEYEFEGFEGPEKKLELEFRYIDPSDPANHLINSCKQGLRQLTASEWQEQLLNHVHCLIISQTSDQYLDSYILSESSLFVYPFKLILKTCGTTTLLRAVEPILAIAKRLKMTIDFCWFSRKNYVFPQKQLAPHTSWDDEVKYLNKYFPDGDAYIVGPMSKDHWYLFLADYRKERYLHEPSQTLSRKLDQTFEVLMHELSPERMKHFFKDEKFVSSEHVTKSSGIADLLPGSVIDAFQFDPCGYSMNGLLDGCYWTIHITPEAKCSFASFETNYLPSKGALYYNELIKKILHVFQPGRFSITLLADDDVPISLGTENLCHNNCKTFSAFSNMSLPQFNQLNKSFTQFDGGYHLTFMSFKKLSVLPPLANREQHVRVKELKEHGIEMEKSPATPEDPDENVSDSSGSDCEFEHELYSPTAEIVVSSKYAIDH